MIRTESRRFTVARCLAALPSAKRMVDLLFGVGLLFVLAPIMALTASLLFLQGGPVLFRQRRVGLHGREFMVLKFRTMVPGADSKLIKLLADCPKSWAKWKNDRKLPDDPRVTRLGYILRKTSIDEFPQLWNVLRGEMSLVGPRPVPQDELREKYGLARTAYQSVRPGLTGLWQVSGRNTVSYEERVAMDQRYVSSSSLPMDMHILWRTLGTVIRCSGH